LDFRVQIATDEDFKSTVAHWWVETANVWKIRIFEKILCTKSLFSEFNIILRFI
jgi:hypothetical protein